MLVYGELETNVRFSECFGLLINDDFSAMDVKPEKFQFLEKG